MLTKDVQNELSRILDENPDGYTFRDQQNKPVAVVLTPETYCLLRYLANITCDLDRLNGLLEKHYNTLCGGVEGNHYTPHETLFACEVAEVYEEKAVAGMPEC